MVNPRAVYKHYQQIREFQFLLIVGWLFLVFVDKNYWFFIGVACQGLIFWQNESGWSWIREDEITGWCLFATFFLIVVLVPLHVYGMTLEVGKDNAIYFSCVILLDFLAAMFFYVVRSTYPRFI